MNDTDILTALSFLKVDDRALIEKIILLLVDGKRVSLVMEDFRVLEALILPPNGWDGIISFIVNGMSLDKKF
jgi:hypothetical protein